MKHQSIKGNKICKALVLMLALALLLTTASIPAFAAEGNDSPFICHYSEKGDGTLVIDGYQGEDKETTTHILVPGDIDGEKVSKIATHAFCDVPNL